MNLKSELEKFKDFVNEVETANENNLILNNFTTLLKHQTNQTRQQFKVLQEVEQIKTEFETRLDKEKQMLDAVIDENITLKKQKNQLVRCLIDQFDLLFNFYSMARKFSDLKLEGTIDILYNESKKKMIQFGFIPIEEININFDSEIHYTIKTINSDNYENNFIVEVLKPGIIFNNTVIKKAEVIVNNKGE